MTIEKAFAITASPQTIYDAIERDLRDAEGSETFEVLRREEPHLVELRVTMGGVPCWLTYRLTAREDDTEVAATLVPFGWRYAFFRIITFGMSNQGFEVALVEALANLKAEVESPGPG